MKLYNYFRSSASFRVRIALAIKQLPFDYVPVHLLKGEHKSAEFAAMSADKLVPVLEDGGNQLSQSLAIMEYLDEVYPDPALLPADPLARARVRALALSVACDIHPLNNLRVLKYLVRELKVSEESKNEWYRHWCREGLMAVDRQLERWGSKRYCVGDAPTLADCCLVPQVFNALRFDVSLQEMPHVRAVFDLCMQHPAFQAADPSRCPDAE